MRKIVINNAHGGFKLSLQAQEMLVEKIGEDWEDWELARDLPELIEVIETLGTKKSSARWSELKIVEIPSDVEWEIQEYDGCEWVAEKHRRWY